jgi:phosphate transport system permease protein
MSTVIVLICLVFGSLLLIPLWHGAEFFLQVPALSWMSMQWAPDLNVYGFGVPLIGSTLLIVATLPLTLALGWVLAFQTVETTNTNVRAVAIALMQTWASLPSVVVGVWAISTMLPAIRELGGSGYSLLATSIALTVFIAPSCALLLMQSYGEYRAAHGDLERALNLTAWEKTVYFVKGCGSELTHIVNYTFCRLFGETLIVLMLSGNMLQIPGSPFDGFRTLTATVALEIAYATGTHELALYAITAIGTIVLIGLLLFSRGRRHETA